MTFETLVDESRKLKIDALEDLVQILKAAIRDKRRAQIRREVTKLRADVKAGKKFKTLADLEKI
jgi:type II secretory pathway component PulF